MLLDCNMLQFFSYDADIRQQMVLCPPLKSEMFSDEDISEDYSAVINRACTLGT